MSSTNILTLDQGIILMIETGLFLIFYYIYHIFFGDNMPFTNVFFTTLIFPFSSDFKYFNNFAYLLKIHLSNIVI